MRSIRIAETTLVRDERVVILNDIVFSDFPPFCGIFIHLDPLDHTYRKLSSGRKVVTVACHWEGSADGDDHLQLMTSDQPIKIVQPYTGTVVSMIESVGQDDLVTWDTGFLSKISALYPWSFKRVHGE